MPDEITDTIDHSVMVAYILFMLAFFAAAVYTETDLLRVAGMNAVLLLALVGVHVHLTRLRLDGEPIPGESRPELTDGGETDE